MSSSQTDGTHRRLLIHSATRVGSSAQARPDGWVLADNDVIAAVGEGDSWKALPEADLTAATTVVDATGCWLTPGFIDVHSHGGDGANFDDGLASIATSLAYHRGQGTTRSVLSLESAPIEVLSTRLRLIAELTQRDPLVLGSHLEGPFLAAAHRGANDATQFLLPDHAPIARLIDAAAGTLVQVTIAPELSGASRAIEQFVESGTRVAIGHTDATFAETMHAFECGATALTHAFNGMPGIHHREPGPVVAALIRDDVMLELIGDGHHVHPAVMSMLLSAAAGRVMCVSDATAPAGRPDGAYRTAAGLVTLRDGVARSVDGGSLAGSVAPLSGALRQLVFGAGIPIENAVAAMTSVPARFVSLDDRLGRLLPGFAADLVMLDQDLMVQHVWADGRELR